MRRLMGLFVVAMLANAPEVRAQCSNGAGLWPQSIRIEPAPALPGVELDMVLGPPGLIFGHSNVTSRDGTIIRVTGGVVDGSDIGLPPAPGITRVPLGAFSAGEYTLVYQPRSNSQFVCTPMTQQFVVGTVQAAEPVPLHPLVAVGLAILVALAGFAWLREVHQREG